MAASLDNLLRPGETVRFRTRLPWTLLLAGLVGAAVSGAFLALFSLKSSSFIYEVVKKNPQEPLTGSDWFIFTSITIVFVLVFLFSAKQLFDWRYCEIAVTDQRVVGNLPSAIVPFVVHSVDIPLGEIDTVSIPYSNWVVLADRVGRETTLRNFARPAELRRQIMEAAGQPVDAPEESRRQFLHSYLWSLLIIAGFVLYYAVFPLLDFHPLGKTKARQDDPKAADFLREGHKEKDPRKKIELYTLALDLDPKNPVAYNSRGCAHYTLKAYDQALGDFDQALALKPDYAMAFYNRGSVHLARRSFPQARTDFDQAIRCQPDLALAYQGRGHVFFNLKDYDQALKDYDKAIQLKPNLAWAYYRRAIIYQQKGDLSQARSNYDKAKSLNPKLPDLALKEP